MRSGNRIEAGPLRSMGDVGHEVPPHAVRGRSGAFGGRRGIGALVLLAAFLAFVATLAIESLRPRGSTDAVPRTPSSIEAPLLPPSPSPLSPAPVPDKPIPYEGESAPRMAPQPSPGSVPPSEPAVPLSAPDAPSVGAPAPARAVPEPDTTPTLVPGPAVPARVPEVRVDVPPVPDRPRPNLSPMEDEATEPPRRSIRRSVPQAAPVRPPARREEAAPRPEQRSRIRPRSPERPETPARPRAAPSQPRIQLPSSLLPSGE
jgi:hypothetical protein